MFSFTVLVMIKYTVYVGKIVKDESTNILVYVGTNAEI